MITQAETPADPTWAWAVYETDTDRPWTLRLAAHLYRRVAFGADWIQLQQAVAEGPQRTVDRLLKPQVDVEAFNRAYDEQESIAAGSIGGLQAWWLRRMVETPHPLLEKMMLFWHGHFATSATGLKEPRLMRQHVQILRRHALGSFADLLQAISRDPATLTWLGAEANRKAAPSQGFVRPLMEDFTVGPGAFTEADVCEAARAWTGWFVLRGQLRYIEREHDDGVKRIMGQEGRFDAEDVVRIALGQSAASRRWVRRLYRWLIDETDEPDDALIAPLAESFAKDYNILRLVETMLRSNLFFSPAAYRRRVKCPVEYAVGIARAMEQVVSTTHLAEDVAALGQDLCRPPTVKGWTGGRCWINAATMAGRLNLAQALLRGGGPYGDELDPRVLAQRHGYGTPESAAGFLLDLFLQGDIEAGTRNALLDGMRAAGTNDDEVLRGFAQSVVMLPEFHLA